MIEMNHAAKIGVWLHPDSAGYNWKHGQNLFQLYIEEILSHAGVPFRKFEDADSLKNYEPDIILIAHHGEKETDIVRLEQWIKNGATVIDYGSLNRMASKLGCREIRCREAVYAELDEVSFGDINSSLRAVRVKPWIPEEQSSSVIQSYGTLRLGKKGTEIAPARLTFRIGKGKLIRWNVDIPSTIVWMQQGREPVFQDGIPSLDGTGDIDEGILKADDGSEMDWDKDRTVTGTGVPYFHIPYADLWREVMIQQLIAESDALELTLPLLDYWPEGTEQVAMISHDSDFNVEEAAHTTLQVLEECGVRSTWCMIEPGYSPSIYKLIQEQGHELAFHYNALEKEGGIWSPDEFNRQLDVIRRSTGASIISNKNHYTRFEGWGEFFRWCEDSGIQADQTRGPSKKGNVGFPFGTCHPYYPIAWADEHNRIYSVLQIGFLTQDLEHPSLPDVSVIKPFLEAVAGVRGVAHFLFHQQHIHQLPAVRDAVRSLVAAARSMGYAFWTCEEITKWEQSRRSARLYVETDRSFYAEQLPQGAVMLTPVNESERSLEDGNRVIRFGVPCHKQVDFSRTLTEQQI
ncbi:hypothetical protein SAMN05661091_2302 [Paenibacillus uliginis N3/975]|uniref:NodB homology domain-containing protein n=1 Tax=Paenibacillus uliginis N3/975 TaxID=1313296 RepID=A0A1X7HB04_9BACL|nr:hypothetical protein [Paenibacillus uliginis]SMF83087.1 hypothetical protein SAMN05661091_2302 [Paenibacillus uliginis N3/975]